MQVLIGVRPDPRPRATISREFRALLTAGARLLPAGTARDAPEQLLGRAYLPRHAVTFFDVSYYLTDFRYEEGLNFLVGYVAHHSQNGASPRVIYPRIFYKDSSLIWRVASHVIASEDDAWIGKGDLRQIRDADGIGWVSDEDTTNLPYEMQSALDEISRRRRPTRDERAVRLVLRHAPEGRVQPYADFTAPRVRAAAAHRLNGGRPVARLTRQDDPESLRFARGFEPDFDGGLLEIVHSGSRLYGGAVRKFRVLSANRQVQYQFIATPTHCWINPPQALTSEITSYGVRALHVPADDAIFVPGYEFHYLDDSVDPPEWVSQIPKGFAGEPSSISPDRADASAWIESLPVIREFRREVLGERPPRKPRAR